jgi:hypothetical protein
LGKELRIRATRFFLHLNQKKSFTLEKRNIFVKGKRSFLSSNIITKKISCSETTASGNLINQLQTNKETKDEKFI